MARLRDVLTASSSLKFKWWNTVSSPAPVTLRMRSGTRALVRPGPSTDFNVFYEVFVKRVYQPPCELDPMSVRLIVDLGANVGYSNLFWLERYPLAEVVTYEPHPRHVDLVARNLVLNRLASRVVVRPVAAGTAEETGLLSDRGSESTILASGGESGVRVRIVDLFCDLPEKPIDILKIDIEGGEYALLRDVRFANLRPRLVCLEVHPDAAQGIDRDQAAELWTRYWSAAGYEVSMHQEILWAVRI